MDEINYLNIKNKKNELDKKNINYIYSNKEIRFYNDINIKIRDSIKKNKKYFNFMLNKSTHIYGQIIKKLQIDKELKFTLVQIIKDNDGVILQTSQNCIMICSIFRNTKCYTLKSRQK